MIAISDIILLTVSSAVLAVALVRSNGSDSSAQNYKPQTPSTSISQTANQSTSQTDNNTEITQTGASTTEPANSEVNTGNASNTTETPVQPATPEFVTYTVQSGDSLSRIAEQFNTSVSELQTINDLSSTRILVGQILLYRKN